MAADVHWRVWQTGRVCFGRTQNLNMLTLGIILFLFGFVNSHVITLEKPFPNADPVFEVKYFDQFIDHFNFYSHGNKTYKQRYLITEQYWTPKTGPIFFYTGNEGDINGFQKASGFLTDHAPGMGALVVFAEHRYYGTSLPFGQDSYTGDNIGYLTIEQAMADFAYLIRHLKKAYGAPDVPVIAFGGSYGGQLAAYMRIKYPNLVTGSLAASAPLYWITGHGDRHGFWESVTEQFGKHSDACVKTVKQGFAQVASYAADNKYAEITKVFKTCQQISSSNLDHFYGWVRNSFTDLAMMNYPYPSDLLAPLPGYPVNTACDLITKAKTPIEGLAAGAGLFYNGTASFNSEMLINKVQSLDCFDIVNEFVDCADPTGCGLGNDAKAWNYQACTEISLPGGTNNMTDMFPNLPFTLAMRDEYCDKNVNVVPRNSWADMNFWTEDLKLASNIIFSNGDLDPWGNGGIMKDLNPSIHALTVKGGAHHLDLRGSNPKDPQSVIDVRATEASIISGWVTDHYFKLVQSFEDYEVDKAASML